MSTAPAELPDITPLPAPGSIVESDRPCVQCSYNLRGLPVAGRCPECGTPVEQSLRGILLQYAGTSYLAAVRLGVSLVLNGILLLIVVQVGSILASVGIGSRVGRGSTNLDLLLGAAQLVPTAIILFGYWRFTEPDPGFLGMERPDSARRVVRTVVSIQAAVQLGAWVIQVIGGVFPGGSALATLVDVATVLGMVVGFIAWAVQFFAMMRYVRWLARRIPDLYIIRRSSTYMWLLPLLYTVGALACVGPLIALVMYWNLLDRVRKHLKAIDTTGRPASLPGVTG